MLHGEDHRDYEHVLGTLLSERYDSADLQRYLRIGLAKSFNLPRDVADEETVRAINEDNADRVDLTFYENLGKVPIRVHVLIDASGGIPYCWAFTLNLTRAKDEEIIVDIDRVKEIAKETISARNLTGIEEFSDPKYPEWPDNDLLMINILNAPPSAVLKFVWRIRREAMSLEYIENLPRLKTFLELAFEVDFTSTQVDAFVSEIEAGVNTEAISKDQALDIVDVLLLRLKPGANSETIRRRLLNFRNEIE